MVLAAFNNNELKGCIFFPRQMLGKISFPAGPIIPHLQESLLFWLREVFGMDLLLLRS